MRHQSTDAVSIDRVVDHYAAFFRHPKLRAQAFKASLAHVSWLAPEWRPSGGRPIETQEERLDRALSKMSYALLGAHHELKPGDETNAFNKELLSAVSPAFCSRLLAPMLEKVPAFIQCGDGLAVNIAHIKAWKGTQLFPLKPNLAKGNTWEAQRRKDVAATHVPEQATGAAMKRGAEGEVGTDPRQQRPRLGSVIDVDRQQAPVLQTWSLPAPSPTLAEEPTDWNRPDDGVPIYSNNYSHYTNTNTNSSSNNYNNYNAVFVAPSPLRSREPPLPRALEQEAMVPPTQSAMPTPARPNPAAAAVQFRVPAHARPIPTTPPEALRPHTLERLTQLQRTQEREPILPVAQATAHDPVRTPALGSETPTPADPALPGDLFDAFDWEG